VSLFKISYESILLSAQCTKTIVKVAYIHNSWSTNNSVGLETFLCVNGSCHRPFDQSMHANFRGPAVVVCNQLISLSLTLCTNMALVMQSISTVVNKNPKLRLKNSVRAKFSHLKCGKNLETRSFKSRKIIHYL